MALPYNELTRRMAEEYIRQWLDKESSGMFPDRLLQELWLVHVVHPRVACIPIIPPGQEDGALDGADAQNEQPKSSGGDAIDEGYFEKRIKRVDSGGPPPRGKRKISPTAADWPIKSDEEIIKRKEETEAVHRAISVRR
jgi:hypothetical protein